MRTLLVALAMLMPLVPAHADCDPPGQFRIVSANTSPGISKESFAGKPKVLYRAGKGRVRIEELPDPAARAHLLMVAHWPDVWFVNLTDKNGEHAIDDGKTPAVSTPALDANPPDGMPKSWQSLEFGCEWDFFVANKATQAPTAKHDMTKHQITEGAWRVTLITANDSQVPWALMLAKDDNVVYAIRYLSYEHRDEIDPALFAKPEGIKFEEPLK
jgi:hypothetical protein